MTMLARHSPYTRDALERQQPLAWTGQNWVVIVGYRWLSSCVL